MLTAIDLITSRFEKRNNVYFLSKNAKNKTKKTYFINVQSIRPTQKPKQCNYYIYCALKWKLTMMYEINPYLHIQMFFKILLMELAWKIKTYIKLDIICKCCVAACQIVELSPPPTQEQQEIGIEKFTAVAFKCF